MHASSTPSPTGFLGSLKSVAVEEPIDLLVHRPLGWLVARLTLPTPVSADALTLVSMAVGLGSAAAFLAEGLGFGEHHVLGGLLLILSAVFDCADGQLARMRQHSSRWGRMLDGAVDAVVQMAVIPTVLLCMVHARGGLRSPGTLAWLVAGILAVLTGWRHTSLYDHFKSVYFRNTLPESPECNDLDEIEAEWQSLKVRGRITLGEFMRYWAYRTHLDVIAKTIVWLDPYLPARFDRMPRYSPEHAARFLAENQRLMRAWSFYGIGTHIFLLGTLAALGSVETYVVLRLVAFNVALLALVPLQRRASKRVFGSPNA